MNISQKLSLPDGNVYTIIIYDEENGQRMVYLSDDHAGDVTLPIDVFRRLANVANSD